MAAKQCCRNHPPNLYDGPSVKLFVVAVGKRAAGTNNTANKLSDNFEKTYFQLACLVFISKLSNYLPSPFQFIIVLLSIHALYLM